MIFIKHNEQQHAKKNKSGTTVQTVLHISVETFLSPYLADEMHF